ncbi:MAG: prephenate dehydrogenase [Actinomycetes bacterium]
MSPPAPQRVVVVGTGLVGTSLGLALRRQGVTVNLTDTDPDALRDAVTRGAGQAGPADRVADLCVVCVPPEATARTLRTCQSAGLARAYTDTASVKGSPLQEARRLGVDLSTVVGGHPMAGAERSGPDAARGDLFSGRPWVLTPTSETRPAALDVVTAMLGLVGAVPVLATPGDHDAAVATVSHAPQVVASLLAGLLDGADPLALGMAGQGLRDTVRVAASPPDLWRDILTRNAGAVGESLDRLLADLTALRAALDTLSARPENGAGADPHSDPVPDPGREAATATLDEVLARGRRGHARLPGKHGGHAAYGVVSVVVDDAPGRLAGLFADVGESGVNVEDVAIDHAPGQPQGLVQLAVAPDAAGDLSARLLAKGWSARPGP